MKNIKVFFLSENVQFLEVNFSIHLNRCVFVMIIMRPNWEVPNFLFVRVSCDSHKAAKNNYVMSRRHKPE